MPDTSGGFQSFFGGLRVRLLLIIALVAVPLFVALLINAERRITAEEQRAREEALLLSRSAAAAEGRMLEGTRQMLTVLARQVALQKGDVDACNTLISDVLRDSAQYINLGATDADGDIYCSVAQQSPAGTNITDRSYYMRAKQSGGMGVGEFQIGRVTRQPTLVVARSIIDQSGEFQGVVFAALDLRRLQQTVRVSALPPGSTVLVMDRNGVIIARDPHSDDFVGQSLATTTLGKEMLKGKEGTGQDIGVDGVERVFGFSPILGPDGEPSMFVRVGLSRQHLTEAIKKDLRNNLYAFAAVLLALSLVLWLAVDRLLLAPVIRVTAAAKRLSEGDLEARAGPPYGGGEYGELARAFDGLANSFVGSHKGVSEDVEEKIREFSVQATTLDEQTRNLRALVDTLPMGVFLVRAPDGEPIMMNDIGIKLAGRGVQRGITSDDYIAAYDVVYADGRPYPKDQLPIYIALHEGRQVINEELCIRHPDGTIVPLRATAAPVHDAEGHVVSAVALFEERKR